MAGGAIESGRSVASRVAAILMAFRSGGTHSLTEVAGLAGLPISTTHRLVGELVSRRVLERTEGGGYRVGLPLRMIGGIALPSSPTSGRPAPSWSAAASTSAPWRTSAVESCTPLSRTPTATP